VSAEPVSFEERWSRPAVMGVLNVTPDSFSDGGRFLESNLAVEHGRRLASEGASLVDVGGESTRPGAAPVSADEELRRVTPVLEGLTGVPLSIDTTKAVVARRALELGAELVNDVTALRGDPELVGVVAERHAFVCLMHMQGEPRTMQAAPRYDDVVSDVVGFLEERIAFAVGEGIAEDRICVDPGIGFGKAPEHNLELLRRLDEIGSLGRPVLVGASRKSTLGKVLGDPAATRGTLAASLAAAVVAYERGAWMIRAHEVRETVEALAVAAAVERGQVTA
jgi:dihydropteroate synthase